jgi:hypothetical protein
MALEASGGRPGTGSVDVVIRSDPGPRTVDRTVTAHLFSDSVRE